MALDEILVSLDAALPFHDCDRADRVSSLWSDISTWITEASQVSIHLRQLCRRIARTFYMRKEDIADLHDWIVTVATAIKATIEPGKDQDAKLSDEELSSTVPYSPAVSQMPKKRDHEQTCDSAHDVDGNGVVQHVSFHGQSVTTDACRATQCSLCTLVSNDRAPAPLTPHDGVTHGFASFATKRRGHIGRSSDSQQSQDEPRYYSSTRDMYTHWCRP